MVPEEKRCPVCKTTKPASEFYLKRTKAGTLTLRSLCRACQMKKQREYRAKVRADKERYEAFMQKQREYHRMWREYNRDHLKEYTRERARLDRQNPERAEAMRENARRSYWRIRQDPERYREYRQRRREEYAIRRDRAGKSPRTPRAKRLNHSAHTGLPIGPFLVWLDEFFEREREDTRTDRNTDSGYVSAYEQLATVLGRDMDAVHRAVHRWRKESKVIPLDYADAILTALDSPARLYELWPELAEDHAPALAHFNDSKEGTS